MDADDPILSPETKAFLEHAGFRARESPSGIGAAVTSSSFRDGAHRYDAIVTDGSEWHYVWVLGPDLGPFPSLEPEVVEAGIERFATRLEGTARIRQVLDANPLHIDRIGVVRD